VSGTNHQFSGQVWEAAAKQHGVLSRRQLIELGFDDRAIEHRLNIGRLHRITRGVYAVGRPELTRRGRWMAAILACGPEAVLSYRSAAELWGVGTEREGLIEVSLRENSARKRPGVKVYRRPKLEDRDVTSFSRIPLTGIVRTMLDCASRLDGAAIERMVNQADARGLIRIDALRAELESRPGQWGVGKLRDVIDRRTFRLTDSELERRFLSLVEAAGLSLPQTGRRLNGFKVDFFWPDLGLVVETDGLTYHRTPAQQARDLVRDQAQTAAGLSRLRFSHAQVRFEPDHVIETLVDTARLLGASPRPRSRHRHWRLAS
jgi:very-short-patch-repair endonuclease